MMRAGAALRKYGQHNADECTIKNLERRNARLVAENKLLHAAAASEAATAWSAVDRHRMTQERDRLVAALRKYGRHSNECHFAAKGWCICGFDAALRPYEETT